MLNWSLVYHSFKPQEEGLREALCTLGNGYFATRGAGSESCADDTHYPGTYFAGGYNRLLTEISGRIIENEDLVNMPNWLCLSFRIEESQWFNLKAVDILNYHQELNFKEGFLQREVKFRDAYGRISLIKEKRFVHMRHSHLAAIQWTLTALDWSGKIEIKSALNGTVENLGVKRYRDLAHHHLEPLKTELFDDGIMLLKVKTTQSEILIAEAAKTKIIHRGETYSFSNKTEKKDGYIAQYYSVFLEKNESVSLEKTVAFYTSKDYSITEPALDALNAIRHASDFNHLLESQIHTWNGIWNNFGIDMHLDIENVKYDPLLILRLHLFHLIQTVSVNTLDLDVGIPARGLHGEAYRGHIFWDEIFIFPTLNIRMPEITLALLKYRYRRLDEARVYAKERGYKGAMYPWQSGSNGREETQMLHLNPKSGHWLPDYSSIQRHVNVAIAYNIWRYFETTGNIDFLYNYGAEMIFEIMRFWASLAEYNDEFDRYEIKGVMGPDEYHDAYPNSDKPGVNNNAYTNIMAAWVMSRGIEIIKILSESRKKELFELLYIREDEITHWHDLSEKMRVCFHDNQIISQFEGYEKLEEFNWQGYRKKYGDIQRLDRILESEGKSTNDYKLSKQADLLMLFYLFSYEELLEIFNRLNYPFDESMVPKNIEYYMERTSHGSTLSRIVHSWVTMKLMPEKSWSLFTESLQSDILDIQGGTTSEGVHLGVMAGTLDIVQRCYTGLQIRHDVLWFDPHPPERLKYLNFQIHFRGNSIHLELTHEKLTLSVQQGQGKSIQVGFGSEVFELHPGDIKTFNIKHPRAVEHIHSVSL